MLTLSLFVIFITLFSTCGDRGYCSFVWLSWLDEVVAMALWPFIALSIVCAWFTQRPHICIQSADHCLSLLLFHSLLENLPGFPRTNSCGMSPLPTHKPIPNTPNSSHLKSVYSLRTNVKIFIVSHTFWLIPLKLN